LPHALTAATTAGSKQQPATEAANSSAAITATPRDSAQVLWLQGSMQGLSVRSNNAVQQ